MLDTYIIEELKRREQERVRKERQRPTVEIPAQRDEREDDDRRSEREEAPGSGVVQIDL